MTDHSTPLPICGYLRASGTVCCRPVRFSFMRCYYHRGESDRDSGASVASDSE